MSPRRRSLFILIPLALFTVAMQAHAQGRKKPVPPTPEQETLIAEGVALHDKGDFDGAIVKYRQVLDANPDEVTAIYEAAMTYMTKGEPETAIELGERGLEYDSPFHRNMSVAVGTAYDMLKRPIKAINVYRNGIAVTPDFYLLHFNLGVTYLNQGNLAEGTASIKRSAALNPNHPGSHNALATAYRIGGERVPAMLATMRLLVLEPNTARAEQALTMLEALRTSGVKRKDSGNIDMQITMPGESGSPEGDFAMADLVVSMTAAHDHIDTSKASPMEKKVKRFEGLFALLGLKKEDKPVQHGFARDYYAPYFEELHQKGHTEAFCYFINQTSDDKDVIPWLKGHTDKVRAFLEWSDAYAWKAPEEK